MKLKRDIKIYIASPYSKGDMAINVRRQLDMGDQLMNLGYCPFIPLTTHFLHMFNPRPHQEWMEFDLTWLATCDALIRLKPVIDGVELESLGADKEEAEARRLGIPVFYNLEDLNVHFKSDPNSYYIQGQLDLS